MVEAEASRCSLEVEDGGKLKRGCFMVRRLALWRYGAKVVVVT